VEICDVKFAIWALLNDPILLDMLGYRQQIDWIVVYVTAWNAKFWFQIIKRDVLGDVKGRRFKHILLPHVLFDSNFGLNSKSFLFVLNF